VRGWHRSGGLSASTQLLAAGVILGALASTGRYGRVGR
jgi:hypothetical protein